MARRVAVASVLALARGSGDRASAQTGSSGTSTGQNPSAQQSSSSTGTTEETRPATTTFFGDTGLWFVPTGEVLAHGKWSASGYRRGTNYIQGFTNVGDFAGTFAVGIKDRAEIFGSFLFDTRIDRDLRPLFMPTNTTFGGFVDRYPRVNQGWTGDNVGDLYVGAKFNLLSECRQNPAALARARHRQGADRRRGRSGVGTGKADFAGRLHRQQGRRADRGSVRAMRATNCAAARRLRHAGRRVPVGRRRRVSVAQPAARLSLELNGAGAVERHGRRRTAALVGVDGTLVAAGRRTPRSSRGRRSG